MENLANWTAWLAGMLEGEGYIELQQNVKAARTKSHGYGPRIGICSSDLDLLSKCVEIMARLGVAGHVTKTSTGNKLAKRECFAVRVTNQKDAKVLLTALRPFLIRLAKRADKLCAWLDMRLSHAKYNTPYSKAEIDAADDIRSTPSSGRVILKLVA